jgi:murein DD-endopeptidase MepM/ murein hydrolase activator NlpD
MRLAFDGSYPMTQDFGVYDPEAYANYPGAKHPGTDWGLPAGTPLVANQAGVVTVYDRDPSIKTGRGKEVVITNGSYITKTCHMSRIDVKSGQIVKEGDPLGLSGSTGFSTGPHLHNELLINFAYARLQDHLTEEESKMDINSARILSAFLLGNTGRSNPNPTKDALSGQIDDELLKTIVGRDPIEVITEYYNSDQGKGFKEWLYNSANRENTEDVVLLEKGKIYKVEE